MTETSQSLRCAECDKSLPIDHKDPCPECGSLKKNHDIRINETVGVQVSEKISKTAIREYYEKHPVLLPVVVLITIGSPFLGLVLAGGLGVIVGLVIGGAAFFLGLRAVTRVREINTETIS